LNGLLSKFVLTVGCVINMFTASTI